MCMHVRTHLRLQIRTRMCMHVRRTHAHTRACACTRARTHRRTRTHTRGRSRLGEMTTQVLVYHSPGMHPGDLHRVRVAAPDALRDMIKVTL